MNNIELAPVIFLTANYANYTNYLFLRRMSIRIIRVIRGYFLKWVKFYIYLFIYKVYEPRNCEFITRNCNFY